MSNILAYNSNDTLQTSFLAALAQGETGNSAFASTEGVGGSDLTGSPVDQFGFPQWNGEGNSHAAGTYQFQPSTWDTIAGEFNLNFSNTQDQSAGAWYLAEQTYQQKTGGSLEDALSSGNYSSIQSALGAVWPSVTGNAAAPQGLAANLSGAITSGTSAATSATATANASGQTASTSGSSGGIIGTIEQFFVRFGLIIIGGIIIIVALWSLLASQGVVPSPGKVVKDVAAI
jgi:hypothetical protein